jgi:dihydrolipoamide dehydrogenase
MFGPRMEHMAHLLAWAIHSDATVPQLLNRPFYHPVVEEGLRTGLRELARALRVTGSCPPENFSVSPGG